jgi:hypothetical protein
MVYARGQEDDEKLHRSYCGEAAAGGGGGSSGGVGVKFPGWPKERVLLADAFQGRLLMVLPSDPASHVKKVRGAAGGAPHARGVSGAGRLEAAAPAARSCTACTPPPPAPEPPMPNPASSPPPPANLPLPG